MRSTLVLLVLDGKQAAWGHIGDARLYHLREGVVASRTRDHSVVQALVNGGEVLERDQGTHEDRNLVLQALGQARDIRPGVVDRPLTLTDDDRFLLCTDGFWESLSRLEIEIDLSGAADAEGWLDRMASRVIARATAESDNCTAATVLVERESREDQGVAFGERTTIVTRRAEQVEFVETGALPEQVEEAEPESSETRARTERARQHGERPERRGVPTRAAYVLGSIVVLLLVAIFLLEPCQSGLLIQESRTSALPRH